MTDHSADRLKPIPEMPANRNKLFLSVAILLTIDNVIANENKNDLELDKIVDLQNTGGIGCIIKVHPEVESCKSNYVQRVANVVEEGHAMDSEEYRKAFCCGFWSMRDCVANSAKQKCDRQSARTISNMKIYSSEQENVFYTKCDRFEYGSRQCGTASTAAISLWTLTIGFCISLLIRQ